MDFTQQQALRATVDITDSLQQAVWQMQLNGDPQYYSAIGGLKAAAAQLRNIYNRTFAPAITQQRSPT